MIKVLDAFLTGLVLDEDRPGSGRRSAGSSLIVSHHAELVLVSLSQVLHLEVGGVHVSPVTPAGVEG